jgi:hypothetical protein
VTGTGPQSYLDTDQRLGTLAIAEARGEEGPAGRRCQSQGGGGPSLQPASCSSSACAPLWGTRGLLAPSPLVFRPMSASNLNEGHLDVVSTRKWAH